MGFILASANKLEERLERDGGNLKIGTGFAREVETVGEILAEMVFWRKLEVFSENNNIVLVSAENIA